jgi:hypothetical protein
MLFACFLHCPFFADARTRHTDSENRDNHHESSELHIVSRDNGDGFDPLSAGRKPGWDLIYSFY